MIEKFDHYVRTERGFIATKGDLIFDCYGSNSSSPKAMLSVALYRNGQQRAIACAVGGNVRWCREAAVKMIDRYG